MRAFVVLLLAGYAVLCQSGKNINFTSLDFTVMTWFFDSIAH